MRHRVLVGVVKRHFHISPPDGVVKLAIDERWIAAVIDSVDRGSVLRTIVEPRRVRPESPLDTGNDEKVQHASNRALIASSHCDEFARETDHSAMAGTIQEQGPMVDRIAGKNPFRTLSS